MMTLAQFVRETPFFIIAHRGASGVAPENTMEAITLAVEGGAHMVEIDVRTTADNEMVVFHDHVLGRTTNGSGYIERTAWPELKKLDAGKWFSKDYAGEHVPRLDEVLSYIYMKCYLNVEIKPIKDRKTAEQKVQRIINIIQEDGVAPYALLSSFDHDILRYIKEVAPLLYTAALNNPGDTRPPSEIVKECGADGFGCSIHELTKKRSEDLRANRIPWGVYSVDTEEQLATALEYGPTSVVTKFPARISKAYEALKVNS